MSNADSLGTSAERPLAVVTGASSGIGRELATLFVEHGYDLVICTEDDGILTAADQLNGNGSSVQAVQVDLRQSNGVARLYAAITQTSRPVEALALNAGVGQGGAFLDTELQDELSIVALNIVSTLRLAKLVLRDMAAQGAGKVLITSSIASSMPGSYQAVYNASKSFLQSFAEALQTEFEDAQVGVSVTSLMPGPTETNFFVRAGMADNTKVGRGSKDDPAAVAKQGFDALMSGEHRVVAASLMTKAQELVNKALPDRVKAAAHKVMAKPPDDDDGATENA